MNIRYLNEYFLNLIQYWFCSMFFWSKNPNLPWDLHIGVQEQEKVKLHGTVLICIYTALKNSFHGCESIPLTGDMIWQKASGLCQPLCCHLKQMVLKSKPKLCQQWDSWGILCVNQIDGLWPKKVVHMYFSEIRKQFKIYPLGPASHEALGLQTRVSPPAHTSQILSYHWVWTPVRSGCLI